MHVSLFKIISSGWIGDRPLRLASVRAGSGRYPDCDGSRGLIRGNYHLARRGKWDARILEGKEEREGCHPGRNGTITARCVLRP